MTKRRGFAGSRSTCKGAWADDSWRQETRRGSQDAQEPHCCSGVIYAAAVHTMNIQDTPSATFYPNNSDLKGLTYIYRAEVPAQCLWLCTQLLHCRLPPGLLNAGPETICGVHAAIMAQMCSTLMDKSFHRPHQAAVLQGHSLRQLLGADITSQ